MKFIENPRHMCDRVFEMVKEITARIKMLKMELKSRGRETLPLDFLTSRLIFMPPKELWEAYSNRTVRPSVRQSVPLSCPVHISYIL